MSKVRYQMYSVDYLKRDVKYMVHEFTLDIRIKLSNVKCDRKILVCVFFRVEIELIFVPVQLLHSVLFCVCDCMYG